MTESPIVELRIEADRVLFEDPDRHAPPERLPWLWLVLVTADGRSEHHQLSCEGTRLLLGLLTEELRGREPPSSAPLTSLLLRSATEPPATACSATGDVPPCAILASDESDPRVRVAFAEDRVLVALAPEHAEQLAGALSAAIARWQGDPPAARCAQVGKVPATGSDGAGRVIWVEVEAPLCAPSDERRVQMSFTHDDDHSETWLFSRDEAAALVEVLARAGEGAGRSAPGPIGAFGEGEPWLTVSVAVEAGDAPRVVLLFDDEMVREGWSEGFALRLDEHAARRLGEHVARAQAICGGATSEVVSVVRMA